MQKNNGVAFFLRVGISLLLFAAVIAGMLAAVNAITADRISENVQSEVNDAIGALFSGTVEKSEVSGDYEDGVRNVYRVNKDGKYAGYCIYTETAGYGGTIGMMVGFDTEGSVCGVSIVEISETAGLGSRVNSAEYLSQYNSATSELSIDDVDVITGSTVSSRAVLNGVNLAIRTYALIGGEQNE